MAYDVGALLINSQQVPEYSSVPVGTLLRVQEVIGSDFAGRVYYQLSDGERSYFIMENYLQLAYNPG